jgi:malate synthase
MTQTLPAGIQITGKATPAVTEVLTAESLQFVADLQRSFNTRRLDLLKRRVERQSEFDRGVVPGFLPETASIRGGAWRVAPAPAD